MTKGAERTRWKIRSDRTVDENPRIRLSIASLELANGFTFEQYVMRLPRCAMTVMLDEAAERILLIWRHRFILDRWMWELPGGSAAVMTCSPAWIWIVRYLRAVLTNLRIDQPVTCSIRRRGCTRITAAGAERWDAPCRFETADLAPDRVEPAQGSVRVRS